MLRRMASISKTMPTLLLINENEEVVDSIKEENREDYKYDEGNEMMILWILSMSDDWLLWTNLLIKCFLMLFLNFGLWIYIFMLTISCFIWKLRV